MEFTSYVQGRQLIVALTGEIDHHCAKEYMEKIREKLDAYLPALCILDFRQVSFMDSSGIAVVIHTLRRMQQTGGNLRLEGLRAQPGKVLRAAGIEKLVEMGETEK